MAAIGICCSGLVALAVAQGTPTTMLYQDLGGRGDFVHTATFLVSSEEALWAYARHPWSQEGTSGLWLPPGEGNRRVGFGDRFAEFLTVTYPVTPPTSAGVSTCAATNFVNFDKRCMPLEFCVPGTTVCIPGWVQVHVGCPGSCVTGSGCARTAHTVTSAVIAGTCQCVFPYCAVIGAPLTVQSFTTTGPLCQCVTPSPPCTSLGSGGGTPGGEYILNCVTPPKIGTTFTVYAINGFLSVGQCLSAPLALPGCFGYPAFGWTIPLALFPRTSNYQVNIPVPNNPRLVGAVVCLQGALSTSTCISLSEGIRATVQP
jgi:hypothetical protein